MQREVAMVAMVLEVVHRGDAVTNAVDSHCVQYEVGRMTRKGFVSSTIATDTQLDKDSAKST